MHGTATRIASRLCSAAMKSRPVSIVQLIDDPLAQNRWSMQAQVVVEVAKRRHEREQFDPRRRCPFGQD